MEGFFSKPDAEGKVTFLFQSEKERDAVPTLVIEAMQSIAKDKLITEKLNTEVLPALSVLPFRCYASPMVAMLVHHKNPFYLATTSYDVLWQLHQIQVMYLCKMSLYEKEGNPLAKKLRPILIGNKDIANWNTEFERDIAQFFAKMKETNVTSPASPSATACMNDFARLMKYHTFRYIHVFERLVYDCACIGAKGEFRFLRTPTIPVAAEIPYIEKRRAQDVLNMIGWFRLKQDFWEKRDKEPKMKHIRWEIIKDCTKDLYENFIPYITLWEYAMMLDAHGEIPQLGEASKGRPF